MFGVSRFVRARIFQDSLKQRNQLLGMGLARLSMIPKYGSFDTECGDGNAQRPFGKGKLWSILALGAGGLGLALADNLQANCAEKQQNPDECANKCKESSCIRKMDEEEEKITKANHELEQALGDIKAKAMEAVEAALKAYSDAALIIKEYMDKAYCAIERDGMNSSEFEETWCEVYDLAAQRCEKVQDALAKGQCAWELLCLLRDIIANGKSCMYTSCHPLLITADEFATCAERELLNARAKMDCIQSDSRLVDAYREVLETFRKELKAELKSVTDCNVSEDECARILDKAYKKVMLVQKELALLQIGMNKVPSKQAETIC